jgi:hypothetical protein
VLAREFLRSRVSVAVATAAFALVPRSFLWMIMGGGVTRSLAFLFAILAVLVVLRMYTRRDWRAAAGAAVFSSLTMMSHLEMALFVASSAAVLFVAYGRDRFGVRATSVVGAATLALAAPWWGTGWYAGAIRRSELTTATSPPLLQFWWSTSASTIFISVAAPRSAYWRRAATAHLASRRSSPPARRTVSTVQLRSRLNRRRTCSCRSSTLRGCRCRCATSAIRATRDRARRRGSSGARWARPCSTARSRRS